jgi:ubiquitin-protein ligase
LFGKHNKTYNLEWIMRLMIDDEAETVYAGLCCVVKLTFPSNYPCKPPTVLFDPPIYYPGIKQDTGQVCMDLFKGWAPTHNAAWIMSILHNMFMFPEGELEPDISNQMNNEPEAFEVTVKAQIAELE